MQSGHATHAEAGASHGTLKSYVIGFVLSIILTVIPFGMVMYPSVSHDTIIATILILAVVQILVHLVYFLHMNSESEQRWNVIAFAFTVLIVAILVGGSVWIMVNVAHNMMQGAMAMPLE